MNDSEVLSRIEDLVAEEHRLLGAAEQADLSEADRARLESVAIGLDQCWDLLRRRRAAREFGADPDSAAVRDATTVERYKQ
jgi:hypothetical protein